MIEREAPGGQAGMSSRIENYLGFPTGLSGGDLARRAVVQAQRFGVEILAPQEAVSMRVEGPYRIMKLADGNELSCHAMMIATGVQWRNSRLPESKSCGEPASITVAVPPKPFPAQEKPSTSWGVQTRRARQQ